MFDYTKLAIAAAVLATAAACGGDDDDSQAGTGHVDVLLTDAPGDFLAVPVTIARVDAHGTLTATTGDDDTTAADDDTAAADDDTAAADDDTADDDTATADDDTADDDAAADDDDDDASWFTLVAEAQTQDLLELQNGVTAALGGDSLAAGSYDQIRLILSAAQVVVETADGQETVDLTVPSGAQTGLKIHYAFDVEAGKTYALVLDFDASASIHVTGHGYQLQPTLTVASFEEVEATGDDDAAADDDTTP